MRFSRQNGNCYPEAVNCEELNAWIQEKMKKAERLPVCLLKDQLVA
jgi:hypothetical protein